MVFKAPFNSKHFDELTRHTEDEWNVHSARAL